MNKKGYCGRNIGKNAIGDNGLCGPNKGPRCDKCFFNMSDNVKMKLLKKKRNFQKKIRTYLRDNLK